MFWIQVNPLDVIQHVINLCLFHNIFSRPNINICKDPSSSNENLHGIIYGSTEDIMVDSSNNINVPLSKGKTSSNVPV